MNKLFISVLFVLACVPFAAAQTREYHQNEFYAGYSYNSFPDADNTQSHGFEASYIYNFNRYVGAKGDFSAHFQRERNTFSGITFTSRTDTYRFMGGVEIKDNSSDTKVKPFVHALAGGGTLRSSSSSTVFSSSNSTTAFAFAGGGGLDVKLNNRMSLRVQADYAPLYNDGILHGVRVGAGLVFH